MKKVIFLILSIMTISGISKTMPLVQEISTTQENNKVDLSGNFPTTGTRYLFEPIILMQYSIYLEGSFFNNLGDIIIEIKDDMNNVVYRDIVVTNNKRHFQISLFHYREGSYHIEFKNSQGQYMCGDFDIEE